MTENKSTICLSVGLPQGSVALVTGAAKRLGRQMALALAKNGCDIVLHCNNSVSLAARLAAEITEIGQKAWVLSGDLADSDFSAALIERANSMAASEVNILVNNASIFHVDSIADADVYQLRKNIAIHAISAQQAISSLAKSLPAGKRGRVLNMLDSRMHDVDPNHFSYHLSKRMLLDITRLAALEFGEKLSINAVAPGLILPPEGQGDEYLEELKSSTPMNRYGDPYQIVDAAMFLLSAEFITGQVIYVDGGRHLKGGVHH